MAYLHTETAERHINATPPLCINVLCNAQYPERRAMQLDL
jgi:hypothetical protein